MNFGSYVCSNITHIPLIASIFWNVADEVFPEVAGPSEPLRKKYICHLHRLVKSYIAPVLNYPSDSVCRATFRISDSLLKADDAFRTRWEILPKALSANQTFFLENWLTFRTDSRGRRHVRDDLIQIGTITHQAFTRPPFSTCFAKLHVQQSMDRVLRPPAGHTCASECTKEG